MNLDQMAQKQYQSDQALQGFLTGNAQNATNQYNTAYNNAQNAQNDLKNFTKNMQSGADIYGKALAAGNANAGYNVNNLNQAQNQVSQLTGILGGLPRAIQASNANYGATAGNVANQVATTGANLSQSLQLANQNAQNQLQKQQAGLTGAQQGAQAQIQTQDQQRQAYSDIANNAAQIMSTAQATMSAMTNAVLNGQQLSAQNQQVFAQAKQNYAAAAQAYAQAKLAEQQATAQMLANSQTRNVMNSSAYQQALKEGRIDTSGNITPPTPTTPTINSGNSNSFVSGVNSFLNPVASGIQQAGKNTSKWFGDVAHNLGLFGA